MDNIGQQTLSTPIVPNEEPQIVKPRNNFGRIMRKHGLKFLMGGLLTLVLGAGIWLEVNIVQQRQQVESQASGGCPEGKHPNPDATFPECTLAGQGPCCLNDPPGPPASPLDCPEGRQSTGRCDDGVIRPPCCEPIAPASPNPPASPPACPPERSCGKPLCGLPGTPVDDGNCGKKTCPDGPVCPFASPSPSPSPASGTVSCSSLESSVTAPTLGQTVKYTCHGSFSISGPNLPVAYFRYSTDNGTNWTAAPSLTGANFNIANININKNGDWVVQCRICVDSSATTCTTWGQAN